MSRPLLEIAEEDRALAMLVEELGEEPTPETLQALEKWFAEIEQDKERKLDSYGALIRSCELRAAARKEEVERLAKSVQADTNTIKRLKDRLKLFLELTHTRKVQTRRYTITLCQNGGRIPLEITCEPKRLPDDFKYLVYEPDTEKIREALITNAEIAAWREKATQASTQGHPIPERPAGVEQELPGCKLLPRGQHVRLT